MSLTELTINDLVRLTGAPAHAINYAMLKAGIKPDRRAGFCRLWSASRLEEIQAAIRSTARPRAEAVLQ